MCLLVNFLGGITLKKQNRLLVFLLVFVMILPGITIKATADTDPTVTRIEGRTRVETSIKVSQEAYGDSSTENVVIAGFKGEADALTGTILAASKDAPLLLIRQVDDSIKKELRRLGVKKIYLLGGEKVISKSIENALKSENYDVERVAGSNRLNTAVEIAKESGTKTDHAFLTNDGGNGGSLADALAVGPVSGRDQFPIFLTNKNKLSKQTSDAIHAMAIKKVTIVGGEAVVSKQVEKELSGQGIQVQRIAGKNRYETAEKIGKKYFKGIKRVILTNDGNVSFADALMGGYLGAKENQPILLTAVDKLNKNTKSYLTDPSVSIRVLGGETVISAALFTEIQKLLGIIQPVESELEVHFIDVGQGDSILIKNGAKAMLIDAGDNGYGETVVNYLKQQGIKRLDYVIGTHPHSDHVGGLDDVIDSFDIGNVIMPNVVHNTKTYEDVLLAIKNKGLKITTPIVGSDYQLGDSVFTILAPSSEKYSNVNNYSVAIRLAFIDHSFLFTGDAERLSENEMLATGLNLEADVLKVGHHGSDTSTTPDFLKRVNPKYAVIQVGENNRYNHPDSIVISRLKQAGIQTFRNDYHGTIIVRSDGNAITFQTEKN